MGCTSSVPNTSTSNPNFTDKCVQYEEEYTSASPLTDEANENESKVLPSCDTLVEPIHLARSHKSLAELIEAKPDLDKVASPQTNFESKNETVDKEEEKISKLEEVIGKVIELSETEKSKTQEKLQDPIEVEETLVNSDKQDNTEDKNVDEIENANTNAEKNPDLEEDILSPSQSECSRVTRWEALADIAAELPASLTIDPLTGQIYALSK